MLVINYSVQNYYRVVCFTGPQNDILFALCGYKHHHIELEGRIFISDLCEKYVKNKIRMN
jgi:hypothetical protein